MLGLTEFVTRLPAALAGILTVWVSFCLVREGFDTRVALIAMLLLAISPWHIQFSRWAVRAILLSLFLCWGLLYFQRGLHRPRLLVLSALLFGIALHTYNSARVFVPLFLLGLTLLHWRELWHRRGALVVPCIVFLCILLPLFSFWISPEGLTRARSTITTDAVEILKNYVSYLSPWYLFYSGDSKLRYSILKMGQLHTFEVLTVLTGLIGMFRSPEKGHRVWWMWFLLYPIPGPDGAHTRHPFDCGSTPVRPVFGLRPGPDRRIYSFTKKCTRVSSVHRGGSSCKCDMI